MDEETSRRKREEKLVQLGKAKKEASQANKRRAAAAVGGVGAGARAQPGEIAELVLRLNSGDDKQMLDVRAAVAGRRGRRRRPLPGPPTPSHARHATRHTLPLAAFLLHPRLRRRPSPPSAAC